VKQVLQFWKDCATEDTAELRRYIDESTSKRLYSELFGRYGEPRSPRGDGDIAEDLEAMDLGADGDDGAMADDGEQDDEPEVDPDGWETVTTKKKGGARR
jgi:hypothetical protein